MHQCENPECNSTIAESDAHVCWLGYVFCCHACQMEFEARRMHVPVVAEGWDEAGRPMFKP